MKRCKQCGVEKDESEFSKSARSLGGLRHGCKACHRAYAAERYAADPERGRARFAEYAAANPEKVAASSAAWRASNPTYGIEYSAAWRAANPNRVREYNLQRRVLEKFGISKEAYEAKLVEQGNVCPICGKAYEVGAESGNPLLPCVDHSHTREARLGAAASLRGIVCHTCNRNRVGCADRYLRNRGILDTDPEALPALLKRRVSFAENVARHVTGTWDPRKEAPLGQIPER
jgi:hypothetical protein